MGTAGEAKNNIANKIAKILLEKNCLKVSPSDPFTYASGLKGPMYCDNRKILSYIDERKVVIDEFVELIKSKNLEFDSVCGLATAGIPHGVLVAERLGKPFIYARSKPKGHGKRNQIEGEYNPGDKTLLIEDLVNQGKSLEEAVVGIREAGLDPIACCSIVDYQMKKSQERVKSLGIQLFSLTNFEQIIECAIELNTINSNQKSLLFAWQNDPENWSPA